MGDCVFWALKIELVATSTLAQIQPNIIDKISKPFQKSTLWNLNGTKV